jgi:hypothetical protein
MVSDLRSTDFEYARYRVLMLPCIGGSLVLTLLHVLVLYSTKTEIGYRRTRSDRLWTSLLQDRTRLQSSYTDECDFAGIRQSTFVSLFRRPSLRRAPIALPFPNSDLVDC